MGGAGATSSSLKKRVVMRTEQIWLKPNKTLRKFCHLSKNLYNEANYLIKQVLREQGLRLRYNKLYHHLKPRRIIGAFLQNLRNRL